jgi:hypothetical protein
MASSGLQIWASGVEALLEEKLRCVLSDVQLKQ